MQTSEKQLSFPFQVIEDAMMNPLEGRELTKLEAHIAVLLLDASSEKPIKTDEIIKRVSSDLSIELNFRELKKIIRSLRRNHAFPILTRRSKPAGYWWCQSIEEMKEFARLWQSQYFDEMITLSVILKTNYPKLAGQLRLPNVSTPS
jgi:hypothetical protein